MNRRTAPEWLSQLDATVHAFAELISSLPEELLRPAAWGAREMLAHIVFAYELYVRYLTAMADGRAPDLIAGVSREQNARALAENADARVSELVDRLLAAQRTLVRFASRADAQAASFYFKANSKPRELGAAMRLVDGHLRGHMRDVRRIARLRELASQDD